MNVACATVSGFRLLDGVEISLECDTTIIVGRNNTGKTSLVEVFAKFLGERTSFTIDDFSLHQLKALSEATELWLQATATDPDDSSAVESLLALAVDEIPEIRLDVEFTYDEDDNLSSISDLILDLDPSRHDATLCCRFSIYRPLEFLASYAHARAKSDVSVVEFLRKRMGLFRRDFVAIDKNDLANTRPVEFSRVRSAILCNFIYAQNRFDDTTQDSGHGLSKGFESYFQAVSGIDGTVESLEAALLSVGVELDKEYEDLFAGIFLDLRTFGANRMPDLQEIKVVSDFRAGELLRGSTKVVYQHESGQDLPEAHNGLGFSKLIFIVLQFVAFFESYKQGKPTAGVQLLLLEEPEAHLHPQMQSVFIKNINDFLATKQDWNVQLVITTHSSHVIAESGFSCLRYFDASSGALEVKDLNTFRAALEATDAESLEFLKQYMELHRCDMFFADKLILVEGAAERLTLPAMIRKVAPDLLHEYLSVIEVGGAYAVKFKMLIEFLNVTTLVITDIDSVDPTGHHLKTSTSTVGALTSNVTLKQWLPQKATISELLATPEDDKTDRKVRVAYQVPETGRSETGRSFEEAFILANAEEFAASTGLACTKVFDDDSGARLSVDTIRLSSYALAEKLGSKSDFAFDIVTLSDWNTPRYIQEGLLWLAPQSR